MRREDDNLTRNLTLKESHDGEFPGFSVCLMYLTLGAKEAVL